MDGPREPEADPVVEVTFRTTDTRYPFVHISKTEQCRVELLKILPHEAGRCAEYLGVTGTDPERVMELVEDRDGVESRPLNRRERGGLFEFVVSGTCPVRRLTELGALPHDVVGTDGEGRITADVPPPHDTVEVIDAMLDDHAMELVTKRRKPAATPLLTETEFRRALDDRLTDRQQEVLRTAYESGYYERPRETTGEAIAADLGITPATFSQHIRAAERTLVTLFYEEDAI